MAEMNFNFRLGSTWLTLVWFRQPGCWSCACKFLYNLLFLLYPDCMCHCANDHWFEVVIFSIFRILCSSPEDLRHLVWRHCKRGQQRVAYLHSQRKTRAIHFLETHNPIRWVDFDSHVPMLMNEQQSEGTGLGWWLESGNEGVQVGSIEHGVWTLGIWLMGCTCGCE